MGDAIQRNRFEHKFMVSEPCAVAIREFARSYLVRDPFSDPGLKHAYAIHSIYLDSPALSLCRSTIDGHKNRFKLRIRYYDDNPASPVFFEIKRRVNDAILKDRAAIRRDAVVPLLCDRWPQASDLFRPDDVRAFEALRRFCELRRDIGAQGQVIVSYLREAWVAPQDNSVRLTFDRDLCSTPWTGALVVPDMARSAHPSLQGVILELKFIDRFPNWMRELAEVFGLRRQSVPKYVYCVRMLNTPAAALLDTED